jgi:hypothetical protein
VGSGAAAASVGSGSGGASVAAGPQAATSNESMTIINSKLDQYFFVISFSLIVA